MGSKFNILLVDEESETINILEESLKRLGCGVAICATDEAARHLMVHKKFDAVFAALCVREMGARPLARWIKEQQIDALFFIVTSWKGDLDGNLLLLDGIHGVVHKPLMFSEIRDILLKHLG